MDIDRFWSLIERARIAAGPAADQAVRDFEEYDGEGERDFDSYWDVDDLDFGEPDHDPNLGDHAGHAGESDANQSGESDDNQSSDDQADDDQSDDDDDLDDDEFDDDDGFDDIHDPVARALVDVLAELPAAEIAAFDGCFEALRAEADRDDLANAALLIEHGFLAEDTFDDFLAGLVALGRLTFERAVAEPDSLAEHPVVREIAQAADPRWLGREDLIFAATRAYELVTGEINGIPEEIRLVPTTQMIPVQGLESHEEWSVTDADEAREHLPRLCALFYERSMENRRRVLAKLDA